MHGLVAIVEKADADNNLSYLAGCVHESVCGVKAGFKQNIHMNEKLPVYSYIADRVRL